MRASVEAALRAPARLVIAGVPLLAGAAARARVPKRSTKLLLLLLVFVELFVLGLRAASCERRAANCVRVARAGTAAGGSQRVRDYHFVAKGQAGTCE